jgi:hypothetical protein
MFLKVGLNNTLRKVRPGELLPAREASLLPSTFAILTGRLNLNSACVDMRQVEVMDGG